MSDADPLQQVVVADNGVRREVEVVPERAVVAETPDAKLRRQLHGFKEQARRREVSAAMNNDEYSAAYYAGKAAALMDVVIWLNSERAASGVGDNDKAHVPHPDEARPRPEPLP